ncbi:MAG TPA: formyltransferase family protein, partial [Reyranella sp.]|nr:formyltransferase family protein [Reyranella sp.]
MGLRAVFVGDGSLLIRCVDIFSRSGGLAVGIVTSNARVAEWARDEAVPVLDWPERGTPALDAFEFDYLFSIANLRLIPKETLARAKRAAINFHDSLLPAYAGLNAPSWAIMADETRHGVTWHEMTTDIDGGRVLRQQSFAITSEDTAFTLNARCYEAGAEAFEHLIEDLKHDRFASVAQTGTRSYYGRSDRPRGAATVDLGRPAAEISALARALDFGGYANPLGLPKLLLGKDVLLARSVGVVASRPSMRPHSLVSVGEDRLVVSCADADLCLARLTAPDGSSVEQVLRRNGIAVGEELPALHGDVVDKVTRYDRRAASFEAWWLREFGRIVPTALPYPHQARGPGHAVEVQSIRLALAAPAGGGLAIAAGFVGWVTRLTGLATVSLLYRDGELADAVRGIEAWFP